jgi:hypothetical protein
MLVHKYAFTIPANTPLAGPVVALWKLPAGSLKYIRIYIPPGHHGLAHLSIWLGNLQIAPLPEGAWFEGNDGWIEFEPPIQTVGGETWLVLKGYNEDEAYPHTFYLYAYLELPGAKPAVALTSLLLPAKEVAIA